MSSFWKAKKTRVCADCTAMFWPTGGRQKFCEPCQAKRPKLVARKAHYEATRHDPYVLERNRERARKAIAKKKEAEGTRFLKLRMTYAEFAALEKIAKAMGTSEPEAIRAWLQATAAAVVA